MLSLPSPAIRKLWYYVKLPPAVKWCWAMQGHVGYEEQCIKKRTIPSPKVGSGSGGCWLSEGRSIYTEVPRSFPDVPWSKQTDICQLLHYATSFLKQTDMSAATVCNTFLKANKHLSVATLCNIFLAAKHPIFELLHHSAPCITASFKTMHTDSKCSFITWTTHSHVISFIFVEDLDVLTHSDFIVNVTAFWTSVNPLFLRLACIM